MVQCIGSHPEALGRYGGYEMSDGVSAPSHDSEIQYVQLVVLILVFTLV